MSVLPSPPPACACSPLCGPLLLPPCCAAVYSPRPASAFAAAVVALCGAASAAIAARESLNPRATQIMGSGEVEWEGDEMKHSGIAAPARATFVASGVRDEDKVEANKQVDEVSEPPHESHDSIQVALDMVEQGASNRNWATLAAKIGRLLMMKSTTSQ